MADFITFDAFDKLVPRLSIFRAFLVSPKNLPEDDRTLLDKNNT